MYFFAATTLTLAATLPLVFGSPILDARQNGVTCQTSDGSPVTGDVTDVINQLRGLGGHCPQTNGEASGKRPFHLFVQNQINGCRMLNVSKQTDCTTLVSHNSAAISVCGGVDNGAGSLCSDLASFANQIQQTCNSGNPVRAGGTYTISASKRVEVIHS